MSSTMFNPSRNALDNSRRTAYGWVVRMPDLPVAHESLKGLVVFNDSDKNFYECVRVKTYDSVISDPIEDYWEWRAVTFGADRTYLMPVGKLTVADIDDVALVDDGKGALTTDSTKYTDKTAPECIVKTMHELVYGFHRYGVHFDYLGYQDAYGTKFDSTSKTYYGYKTNENFDESGFELRKIYTGEIKTLTVGTDFTEGETVSEQYKFFTSSKDQDVDSIKMIDIMGTLNKIIAELNRHNANIPSVDTTMSYNKFCEILNMVIDEVNPFAVPWQVLINRIWYCEKKIGPGLFDAKDNDIATEMDFPAWRTAIIGTQNADGTWNDDYTWKNVPTSLREVLRFGTLCQMDDTILRLIQYMDQDVGDLNNLLTQMGINMNYKNGTRYPDLVTYLFDLWEYVKNLKQVNLEGINQLRATIGDIRYKIALENDKSTFQNGLAYFRWNSTDYYFEQLIRGTDFEVGGLISDVINSDDEHRSIYVLDSDESVRKIFDQCIADITKNRIDIAAINKLLGTSLGEIYVEILDKGDFTEGYYVTYNNSTSEADVTFNLIPKTEWNESTFGTLVEKYTNIYIKTSEDTTVCKAVEINNNLIATITRRVEDYYKELKQDIKDRTETIKQLTGLEGETTKPADWQVNGYIQVTNGVFEKYKHYYRKTNDDKFVDLVAGTDYQYPDYKLTEDTIFQAGKNYYYYGNTGGKAGYKKATAAETVELYEKGKGDYYEAHYEPTTDRYFNTTTSKYYTRSGAGTADDPYKYTLASVKNGAVVYNDSYFKTSDTVVDSSKTYYVYDSTRSRYVVAADLTEFNTSVTYYEYDPGTTYYEYYELTVPANSFYEYYDPTPITASSNVWIRDRRWKEYNTHRGLIDRNYETIEECQVACGNFKVWTTNQMAALKDFIMQLSLATVSIVTQEAATLSLMHHTIAKLITIHNAVERLEGEQTFKHADGVYDSGYDYYEAVQFVLTTDEAFIPGKQYFTKKDEIMREATTVPNVAIPAGTYYEPSVFRKMEPGTDYEIGLNVGSGVYTRDLVMPEAENWTINEIRVAVNRVLRIHLSNDDTPIYTELPDDQPIMSTLTYYRYLDDAWEEINPDEVDPSMVGQLIKDYDPDHMWYIKTGDEVADDNYTMTWIRVIMNEMIKLHNRSNDRTAANIIDALTATI